jgi:hypothetical protein
MPNRLAPDANKEVKAGRAFSASVQAVVFVKPVGESLVSSLVQTKSE